MLSSDSKEVFLLSKNYVIVTLFNKVSVNMQKISNVFKNKMLCEVLSLYAFTCPLLEHSIKVISASVASSAAVEITARGESDNISAKMSKIIFL